MNAVWRWFSLEFAISDTKACLIKKGGNVRLSDNGDDIGGATQLVELLTI